MTGEPQAWTDEQLTQALYELRRRGHAAAAYDFDDFATTFDGELDPDFDGDEWMAENRDVIEDVMCEAARNYFLREAGEAFAS